MRERRHFADARDPQSHVSPKMLEIPPGKGAPFNEGSINDLGGVNAVGMHCSGGNSADSSLSRRPNYRKYTENVYLYYSKLRSSVISLFSELGC